MMQAWADYLDALKAGAAVIPLFKQASAALAIPRLCANVGHLRVRPFREFA